MQNINYHLDTRSNIAVCSLQFAKIASAPKKMHVLEITLANPGATVVSLDIMGLVDSESYLFFAQGYKIRVQTGKLGYKFGVKLDSAGRCPTFPLDASIAMVYLNLSFFLKKTRAKNSGINVRLQFHCTLNMFS